MEDCMDVGKTEHPCFLSSFAMAVIKIASYLDKGNLKEKGLTYPGLQFLRHTVHCV